MVNGALEPVFLNEPMTLKVSVLLRDSFCDKKATGCNLGFSPNLCDNMAPIPDSESFTSTMMGLDGSGYFNLGVEVKAQSGTAMELNHLINNL